MKRLSIILLSISAIAYTVYFMTLAPVTTNSGALSKTGIIHPFLFSIWGILVFTALYANAFVLYRILLPKVKFQYIFSALALTGMVLTLCCKFDIENKIQFQLHCFGSLLFSIVSGICIFLIYALNYSKGIFFKISSITIGIILITDLIFLIIFKQNALIEAIPIIFALIIMPATIIMLNKKDKAYAAQ